MRKAKKILITSLALSALFFWYTPAFCAPAPVAEGATIELTAPTLNIPIPGLKFAEKILVKEGEVAKIPYIAQYVTAWARYLFGASVVAAAVMVVYGGFLYILGSTMVSIKRGKEVIQDALIGLFLVLACFVVLSTFNDSLVNSYKPLDILIAKKDMQQLQTIATNDWWKAIKFSQQKRTQTGTPGQTPPGQTPPGQTPGPGQVPGSTDSGASEAPDGKTWQSETCTFELNELKIPTKESIYKCAIKVANEVGIPPCIMVVTLNHESWDGLPNAVGFDEDAPSGIPRLPFLRSGKLSYPKDGSAGFSVPKIPPECNAKNLKSQNKTDSEIASILALCDAAKNSRITNNDIKNFDPTQEDLGFTGWKNAYSRGIGLMQITIFKSSYCQAGVPSKKYAGICYTARDFLDPYISLKAGALQLKSGYNKGIATMFKEWNQKADYNRMLTKETEACIQSGNDPMIYMSSPTICRGDFFPFSRSACREEAKRIAAMNKAAPPNQRKPSIRCEVGCFDPRYPLNNSQITK
jgi:hypothetical protein